MLTSVTNKKYNLKKCNGDHNICIENTNILKNCNEVDTELFIKYLDTLSTSYYSSCLYNYSSLLFKP